MSKVTIAPKYRKELAQLDNIIRKVNERRLELLFKALGIPTNDLEKVLTWTLVLVAVPDRQMAVQLNKLSAYMSNLKFVVDATKPLFALEQSRKARRTWKE
jgi:glycerol-3-phosphate dehydrogenase